MTLGEWAVRSGIQMDSKRRQGAHSGTPTSYKIPFYAGSCHENSQEREAHRAFFVKIAERSNTIIKGQLGMHFTL